MPRQRPGFNFYHGIWDLNEFYDLQTDPLEQHNLINVPADASQIEQMRNRLFDRLESSGGMQIPLRRGSEQAAELGGRATRDARPTGGAPTRSRA